jgi:hypothetical protein
MSMRPYFGLFNFYKPVAVKHSTSVSERIAGDVC